jgi:hypothetical protein
MNRNSLRSQSGRIMSACFTLVLAFAISLTLDAPAHAQFTLVKISSDSFTDTDAQHKTEVEPDTYSWGSTMVAAFQVARIAPGGGADLGFTTSTDGGKTWTFGSLPGWTVNYKHGSASAASDASVVYDAKHKIWLIQGLLLGSGVNLAVSRSQDGKSWGRPIIVDGNGVDDKNWITCDNTPTSKFYGNCYSEWDQAFSTGLIQMSTSHDGGLTWSAGIGTADNSGGSGAEPLVLPNGTVVVPFLGNNMEAFTSTNGGKSWSSTFQIANVNVFSNGNVRSDSLPFPSTGIDKSGKLYVVWSDCSFRSNCSTNDLVMITSTNGSKWTNPARIPIDPLSSTVDHFIPGLAVDRATSGKTAHLTTTYYFYPQANCSFSSCRVHVGFTTSTDGGKTWTAGKDLGAGAMQISWLPNSQNGPMLADYLSSSYVNGKAFGAFMVAKAPSGGQFNQAAYTTKQPLEASADEPRFSSRGENRIPGVHSNRPFPRNQGEERESPAPPSSPDSQK